MAISGVNSANNNNAYYIGGAAATGALAGGLTGWYSKPFLKDGVPTDTFLKKIEKSSNEALTKFIPENVKIAIRNTAEIIEHLDQIKNIEELKESICKPYINIFDSIPEEDFDLFKESLIVSNDTVEKITPALADKVFVAEVQEANSIEDIKRAFRNSIDRGFEGKNLDELRSEMKAGAQISKKSTFMQIFNSVWDADKKKFVKAEENPLSEFISKIAKGIQGKYAAIYGGIGAGILGLGAYLLVANKNNNKEV